MMTSVIELEFDLISADMSIDMEMAEETEVIEFGINSGDGLKPYTGDYDVIPKVVDQVLETKNLGMTDDVTVKEIPMHEVSNDYGTTIIIGGIL